MTSDDTSTVTADVTAPSAPPAPRGGDLFHVHLLLWGCVVGGDAANDLALLCELRDDQLASGRHRFDRTARDSASIELMHDDRRCRPPAWTALPAVTDAIAAGLLAHPGCPHNPV